MMQKNMTIRVLFSLFLACLCGCASPLTVSDVSGVPAVFTSTGSGTGDSAWFARYDDVVQATLDAGQKLSLELREKTIGTDKSDLYFIDDKGSKIEVSIERRSETVTLVGFNIGLFGSTSMGRLMARQIIFEVVAAGSFLGNWHPVGDS